MDDILVPTSPGELIDKLTILRIKTERISDAGKLANIRHEKATLDATAARHLPDSGQLTELWDALYDINVELWEIEDDIRDCERAGNFGETFIALARAVYVTNDRRADVKKRINLLLGSALVEEKSYADYGNGA
ncbi:DUF6165 family protein [Pelagovum pacificum]|uniref:Uncharacterized protein n=1 Tax=Pelagovum pacificum TaxID=2588711 RepID=A0A5C5GJW9_9RHOB|nr:DUF6165 family protein [Pelagovum pacificum]QQA42728.1 hypothetical protein I8N54_18460 [Pelagovum pacificum]TNY34121.1 hypothetical protein FHY64_12920 [Pelagovum pacificum]